MKVLGTPSEMAVAVANTGAMTRNTNAAAEQTARRHSPGRGEAPIAGHREARRRISGAAPVAVRPRPLTGPGRFDHLKRTHD